MIFFSLSLGFHVFPLLFCYYPKNWLLPYLYYMWARFWPFNLIATLDYLTQNSFWDIMYQIKNLQWEFQGIRA